MAINLILWTCLYPIPKPMLSGFLLGYALILAP